MSDKNATEPVSTQPPKESKPQLGPRKILPRETSMFEPPPAEEPKKAYYDETVRDGDLVLEISCRLYSRHVEIASYPPQKHTLSGAGVPQKAMTGLLAAHDLLGFLVKQVTCDHKAWMETIAPKRPEDHPAGDPLQLGQSQLYQTYDVPELPPKIGPSNASEIHLPADI
jgi:hypothetical protein